MKVGAPTNPSFSIRFSAVMLMLGGTIVALVGLRWGIGLIAIGLSGLYRIQREQIGWLGLIGFVVSLIGSIVSFILQATNVLLPIWTTSPVDILATLASREWRGVGTLILWLAILAPIGYIILGMAILRGGAMPHTSALMLIIGALLFSFNRELTNFGNIILGIAFAWMGYITWRSKVKLA